MHDHRAILYDNDGRQECRVCGKRVLVDGEQVRHVGEAVTIIVPSKADAKTFRAAIEAGQHRLSLLPDTASLEERSRAVVEGIYMRGLLRRIPGQPPEGAQMGPEPEPEEQVPPFPVEEPAEVDDWHDRAYH